MKVLPEATWSRLPDKDDDARDEVIGAARRFLKEIMATRGRRTDVESTAFWAAAVALIPSDVLQNRKGRAIMRLLDIDYRVVKKATEMRAGLEDGSKKWRHVTTAKHCDTAFQAGAPVVFAGEHFDEGFYLVKIKWYQFVRLDSAGQRCYRLLDDEQMLSVHSLIRCTVSKLPPVEERGRGRHVPLFTLTANQCGHIAEYADIKDYDIE